jgi:hypothetical protein
VPRARSNGWSESSNCTRARSGAAVLLVTFGEQAWYLTGG